MKYFTIFLVIFGVLHLVNCGCWHKPLQQEITKFGRVLQFCEYIYVTKEKKTIRLKLFPGSEMKSADCVRCTCTEEGLQCCTLDSMEKRMRWSLPSDCEIAIDGCEIHYVMKTDKTRDCFTGQSIWLLRFLHPYV